MPMSQRKVAEVELDLGRYELRRRGRPVKLEKKPMELLIFLVARRDQLVSREEIVTKLWRSDLFVDTEASINNIIRKIRNALGDSVERPRFLETVVGKGYRFIGPVRVLDVRYAGDDSRQDSITDKNYGSAPARDHCPSLAVRPLALLGGIADDHGMCLGFADALASRLGNLKDVDVLPTSVLLNVSAEMSPSELGSRLGVRFVVHGAVRELKGRWHLGLEMFDAKVQSACLSWRRDFDLDRLADMEEEIAKKVAGALNRPLRVGTAPIERYSKDPLAYAEFMRGYRLSSLGDHSLLEEAVQRLSNAVTRDPTFALAHATLSLACATRFLEVDPAGKWSEKAEFHCARALELSRDLPEAHVAKAFLLWSPLRNFQHLDAITELRKAIALQKNLPRAYNRLGTILAHVGLLDRAREVYERGRPFHPNKKPNHSIVQVYLWGGEFDLAAEEIESWRAEGLSNKYIKSYALQHAIMTGDLKEAKRLLDEEMELSPEEPLFVSLMGVYWALTGDAEQALNCVTRACSSPKSFGHAHHTDYQIACIYSLLEKRNAAFEWLDRAVHHGFACWPFFLNDACLQNLRDLPEFQVLVSSLQAKYPEHLGML